MSNKYSNLNNVLVKAISSYCGNHPENGKPLPYYKLAKQLGISRYALGNWLNGTSIPSLSESADLADLLGISIDELAGRVPSAIQH